ncbi:hypothetical protein HON58_03795 [Candidatus Peregrinibacteria bacterium]|nr:hypothetical protein [Candidatus Peregrinibacteria bacterium]
MGVETTSKDEDSAIVPRYYECVISGQLFYAPGSVEDCLQRRRTCTGWRVDGVLTEVGPVSATRLIVYEAACDEFEARKVGGHREDYIQELIEDPEFVSGVLVGRAKREVLSVLSQITGSPETYKNINELRNFLLEGIRMEDYKNFDYAGKGLELRPAMECLMQEIRTVKFFKALQEALDRLDGIKDEIQVVDAGSGPIPIFAIIAALLNDKVKATCLEVNSKSAEMAMRIIDNLGLSDRVDVVRGDAIYYVHDKPIDLLISETMYAGLMNGEEMVDILRHLRQQSFRDGEVIPKCVTVNAGMALRGNRHSCSVPEDELMIPLRKVYEYNAETNDKERMIEFSFDLSSLPRAGEYRLVLSSDVVLGEGLSLSGDDTNITRPFKVKTIIHVREEDLDKVLKISYWPGQHEEDIKMEFAER